MKPLNQYGRVGIGFALAVLLGFGGVFLALGASAQQQSDTGVHNPHGASGTRTPVFVIVDITSTPTPTKTNTPQNTPAAGTDTWTFTPTKTPTVTMTPQWAIPISYSTTVVGSSAVTITPPTNYSFNVLTVHSNGSNTAVVTAYTNSTAGVTIPFWDMANQTQVSTIGATGNSYAGRWGAWDSAIFTPSGAVTLQCVWSYDQVGPFEKQIANWSKAQSVTLSMDVVSAGSFITIGSGFNPKYYTVHVTGYSVGTPFNASSTPVFHMYGSLDCTGYQGAGVGGLHMIDNTMTQATGSVYTTSGANGVPSAAGGAAIPISCAKFNITGATPTTTAVATIIVKYQN